MEVEVTGPGGQAGQQDRVLLKFAHNIKGLKYLSATQML
jgi:hypothetical protein